MKDVNKVIILGRLGADPIQRHTRTGTPVTNFSVATSRRFLQEEPKVIEDSSSAPDATLTSEPILSQTLAQASTPTYTEETQWHKIVVWGKQGEACARYLKKGQPVYVEGLLRTHSYEDKGGAQRMSVEIQAETISFLSSRSETPRDLQPSPLEE